ncbi:MAG TPA: hypothetical protein VFZ89_05545, partial [Solirubrobacteraceae bacterium]
AVLSCWWLLTAPDDVHVINVFTAVPDASRVAWWDRLTGAQDGAARMRERLAEDAQALARAGRSAVNLGLLDGQYRRTSQPAAQIADRVARVIGRGARLYAPAGLGDVPDHDLVRNAALRLERHGHEVIFYADVPHAIRFGWPASVTGEDPVDGLDVEGYWAATLARGIPGAELLSREVHVLDDDALIAKLIAVRTYRTQLPALLALNGRLSDPSTFRYEATWRRR